jgi:hypothetical protein
MGDIPVLQQRSELKVPDDIVWNASLTVVVAWSRPLEVKS